MANKINFDVEDYEPSDSEEEYTPREKSLINKVRKSQSKQEDSDEEVLGFSDSEEDEESDTPGIEKYRDTESEGDDGLPDSKAWGKKKRDYYHTDFVDKDFSQYTAEEEQLAAQEWEEAKQIRERLTKQLNDDDFSLDILTDTKLEQSEEHTKLKTDLTDLSKRERQQLFKKDSPEFEGLVNHMNEYLDETCNLLTPFLDYCKQQLVEETSIIQFVRTYNSLLLNYCNNVTFYLILKAKRITVKNHPVIKRLVQVRKLIDELSERYVAVVRPQIEEFMQELKANNVECIVAEKTKSVKSKMLNIMKPLEENNLSEDEVNGDGEENELKGDDAEGMDVDEPQESDTELGKRGITYQMAKNKGLTARKKPENRNPRVKNRNRFRKAVIRRKGAIREVRAEKSRDGFEATGIKTHVKRSINIK